MTTIHYVHGFNSSDQGDETVVKLMNEIKVRKGAAQAENHETFRYGWLGLIGVWFYNDRIAKLLSERINPGDSVVAFSNGCVIALRAAMHGAFIEHAFFFRPPLKRNLLFPDTIGKIHVIHSDGDRVVKCAWLLRMLFPWIPAGDPLWGNMGCVGHRIIEEHLFHFVIRHVFLFLVQILVAPLALVIWIVLGPLEVTYSIYINQKIGADSVFQIDLSDRLDRAYLFSALVVPLSVWFGLAVSWMCHVW